MEIYSIFFIGVGLSLDAFSLSLCYSTLDISENRRRLTALSVGTFHFFMPLLGMIVGNVLKEFIIRDLKIAVYLVFMLLGIEMISGATKNEENICLTSFIGIVMFSFLVSIDSFSAGIGIKFISNNYMLCSLIFSLISTSFTYIGLKIGNILAKKREELSKIIGGVIFILFSFYYLFR